MLITPPDVPDARGSFHSCGTCGIAAQVMVQELDADGQPVMTSNPFTGEVFESWYNDEAVSVEEINVHTAAEHPEPEPEPEA